MNYMISASTDAGLGRSTNQDSLSVKIINTCRGHMVFAVLCDGLGGLSNGELASAAVVRSFEKWVDTELPSLCRNGLDERLIRKQWCSIVNEMNEQIRSYGEKRGIRLGTTVVAMLLTKHRYYILNVGDSRAYELSHICRQLTLDHTYVERQVALGNMTEEQAASDERRNLLLQCIGATKTVLPDLFSGKIKGNAVYMLCSDGFRHEITPKEMLKMLGPEALADGSSMKKNAEELIELNKKRQEQDNISVVLVRTF